MPHYQAEAIANEFIKMSQKGEIDDLTPMKLQKLVYYAHGWYLANFEEPLIEDNIQAWEYGPVIRSLYSEFKDFGNNPITELADKLTYLEKEDPDKWEMELINPNVPEDDTKAWAVIDKVAEVYGKFTAIQLSNLTHMKGTPWEIVTQEYKKRTDGKIPHDLGIPNNLIQNTFKNTLKVKSNG